MNQSITAVASSAPFRDPDAAAPIFEHDTLEQANFWSSDQGASFGEVLDAINPLHHIPVVSTIYRAVSGDTIGFGPRLIGAAIFGGPLGLIIAGITAFFEEMSGGTVTEHALALLDNLNGGDDDAPADAVAAASGLPAGDASGGARTAAAAQPGGGALAAVATTLAPITVVPIGELPIAEVSIATARDGEREAAVALPGATAMRTTVPMPNMVSSQSASILTMDADSKRISQTLLHAQRAQANLLLANLQAYDAVRSGRDGDEERDDDEDRGPHSNLPPAGGGTTWYADAMLRALDKYRADHATPAGGR